MNPNKSKHPDHGPVRFHHTYSTTSEAHVRVDSGRLITQQEAQVSSGTTLTPKPKARLPETPASAQQQGTVPASPRLGHCRPDRSGITRPDIHRPSTNTSHNPSQPSVRQSILNLTGKKN